MTTNTAHLNPFEYNFLGELEDRRMNAEIMIWTGQDPHGFYQSIVDAMNRFIDAPSAPEC